MNIIIVAKPHARPTTLNLDTWRVRANLAGLATIFILAFAGVGFIAALLFASPRDHTLNELRDLRTRIAAQQHSLDDLQAQSQLNLDALAVQLGQLQARALRLDALGQRLAEVGKLDSNEFDFQSAPALGGPEDPAAVSQTLNPDMADKIAELRSQFQTEQVRLSVLQDLLLDRRVDNALVPKGLPVVDGYIGSGFGIRTDPFTGKIEHHMGLDIDAPAGSPIRAAADGVVTWNTTRTGYGNVVEIDHGNGYMTRYAHNRKNLVSVGQRVHAGQIIAKVGSTGHSTGPHCHFEVWLHGRAVNPIAYVKRTVKKG
ncbi:MAG: M23 family metallopeptidase [Rudaea sp.]